MDVLPEIIERLNAIEAKVGITPPAGATTPAPTGAAPIGTAQPAATPITPTLEGDRPTTPAGIAPGTEADNPHS